MHKITLKNYDHSEILNTNENTLDAILLKHNIHIAPEFKIDLDQIINHDITITIEGVRVHLDEHVFYIPEGWNIVDLVETFHEFVDEDLVCSCGGSLSCSTCHVRVNSHHASLEPPSEREEDLLELTAVERNQNSRLGCAITFTKELNGINLIVPK